jgi:hypothetical protein
MSGIIGSRLNVRGSGLVSKLGTDGQVLTSTGAGTQLAFEDVAGGVSWQSVETGSTMTAVAGNGYPIDTTSNACTITLPASASNGDQIVFTDYARNWGTNAITIDSNGLKYQGDADTYTVEYTTDGQSVNIVYSGSTKGWIPIEDDTVTNAPYKGNQEGIFGYGEGGSAVSLTNLVSNAGVVATDTTGVGTARQQLAACEYGEDKGIFGYGNGPVSMTNLVSNTGVVATDVTGVGTDRYQLAACGYGGDKGIFGFGYLASGNDPRFTAVSNLVSNVGVVATDTTGVGTARYKPAACSYGEDKGIFGYGYTPSLTAVTNLVSNAGVVATDVTGVGTARYLLTASEYGYDKGIFGFGYTTGGVGMTNLVSNVGVVASDVSAVGTARSGLEATHYGGDKAIFGFGYSDDYTAITNLVSNAGVVATDVTGVGTVRRDLAACSFN